MRDSITNLPKGKLYGVAAVETGDEQQSTGLLHLDGFESPFILSQQKKHPEVRLWPWDG